MFKKASFETRCQKHESPIPLLQWILQAHIPLSCQSWSHSFESTIKQRQASHSQRNPKPRPKRCLQLGVNCYIWNGPKMRHEILPQQIWLSISKVQRQNGLWSSNSDIWGWQGDGVHQKMHTKLRGIAHSSPCFGPRSKPLHRLYCNCIAYHPEAVYLKNKNQNNRWLFHALVAGGTETFRNDPYFSCLQPMNRLQKKISILLKVCSRGSMRIQRRTRHSRTNIHVRIERIYRRVERKQKIGKGIQLMDGVPCYPLFKVAWLSTKKKSGSLCKEVERVVKDNLKSKRPSRHARAPTRYGE